MYITTMPNKEVIRRICILNGATQCHLYIPKKTEKVLIVMDIESDRTSQIEKELELWCGMQFKVLSSSCGNKEINKIQQQGKEILPIK